MTGRVRKELPPLPTRMLYLPVDERGYPIPEFVSNLDGKRDFRVVSLEHMANCISDDICWICGQRLEALKAFVIGPLPAIQGFSNEPPSHIECAEFAVRVCPFLLLPKAQHRAIAHPKVEKLPRAAKGNPGVCCVYTVRGYAHQERKKGLIFLTGQAVRVDWYTQGRLATRSEVSAAFKASILEFGAPGNEQAVKKRIADLLPA